MINFKEFIDKDITAKKTLITTLPTKTKTNQKKYNDQIEQMIQKYSQYQKSVRAYLEAKAKSFEVLENHDTIDQLNEKVEQLEHIRFLLNPTNTYLEKMGFDDLLYQLNNSYMLNFQSLNDIINCFLDKFELVGVKLESDDFDYTCYVHEYMSSFLQVRYSSDKKYHKVSEIFESIYWINPELMEHIELNFRKLIRVHAKKFQSYILEEQKREAELHHIHNYQDCIEKLRSAYIDRNLAGGESISDIIELAKNRAFDIHQYMPDHKVRIMAYQSLISDEALEEEDKRKKVCETLAKLKSNVCEFDQYNTFLPIFICFQEEYKDLMNTSLKDYKGLKNIENEILTKEKELEKMNHRIFGSKSSIFDFKQQPLSGAGLKKLKMDTVRQAKELYTLYHQYDKEYFKEHVLEVINPSLMVSDVLNLYYSFAYFRKLVVQKAYKLTEYSEIIQKSDEFYHFAMDPTNMIIAGIPIFEEANVKKVIANKYRLNNIKIDEEDLEPEELKTLLNKIQLILRVEMIEHSDVTSIEKICFIADVTKILAQEEKK